MKYIIVTAVLLGLAGTAQADGAEAFATGFANALNRSMGGNPQDSRPQQYSSPQVYEQPAVTYHYDAVINASNTRGGYYFFNYQSCNRFLNGNGRGVYDECVRVAN